LIDSLLNSTAMMGQSFGSVLSTAWWHCSSKVDVGFSTIYISGTRDALYRNLSEPQSSCANIARFIRQTPTFYLLLSIDFTEFGLVGSNLLWALAFVLVSSIVLLFCGYMYYVCYRLSWSR